MATSTEQINNLIGSYTELKQYFEGARGGILDALASSASRFQGQFSLVHVDQAAGVDTNPGTEEAPVATIDRAIALTPRGAWGSILFRGNYLSTSRISLAGKMISLRGCNAGAGWVAGSDPNLRPTFTVGYYDYAGTAEVAGFHCDYGGVLDFGYCDIQLPSEADVLTAHPGIGTGSVAPRSVFAIRSSSRGMPSQIYLRYAEIHVPADYYGQLFSPETGWDLLTKALVIDGSLAGKYHTDIPSGADPDDYVRFLRTDVTSL